MKLLANSAGVGEVSAAGVSTENTGISLIAGALESGIVESGAIELSALGSIELSAIISAIGGIAGCSSSFTSPSSTAGGGTTSVFGLVDRTNLGFFAAGSFSWKTSPPTPHLQPPANSPTEESAFAQQRASPACAKSEFPKQTSPT